MNQIKYTLYTRTHTESWRKENLHEKEKWQTEKCARKHISFLARIEKDRFDVEYKCAHLVFIYGNSTVFSLHSDERLVFFYLSIFFPPFCPFFHSFPLSFYFDERYFLLFFNFICFICEMQMIFCIHFARSHSHTHILSASFPLFFQMSSKFRWNFLSNQFLRSSFF